MLIRYGYEITMTVAVCTHVFMMGDPFVNPTGGRSFEPALVYWGIAILFLAAGPGKFALDRKFFGDRTP